MSIRHGGGRRAAGADLADQGMTVQGTRPRARRLRLPALTALAALTLPMLAAPDASANPGGWSDSGSLATARHDHSATLLADGKVLVAGGLDANDVPTATAEVYDSASGAWVSTCPLTVARASHTATLLPGGKVLVAGGWSGTAQGSAELFDPMGVDEATGCRGTWSATGPMTNVRYDHTATLLADGTVLVASGHATLVLTQALTYSAELYDPATGTWASTGSLREAREGHTASTLPDGRVLVAGGASIYGESLASTELYDPVTRTWSAGDRMSQIRGFHMAASLGSGQVLVAGGERVLGQSLRSAEIYDSATDTWRPTGDLGTARTHAAVAVLPRGQVLVSGGTGAGATAEVFEPTSGTWGPTGPMRAARADHTATLLPTGKVLAAGGQAASTELYTQQAIAPGAPTNVVATAGNASATVSWTAPADDGGTPITSYTVTASPGGVSVTVDGSTTSAVVTGLRNKTTYTFTVVATSAAGSSPTSAPSNPVTPTRNTGR